MSTYPIEQLLGFDTREMWISFDDSWSEGRKKQYLLRQDIEKPLSVDRLVWQSVFNSAFEEETIAVNFYIGLGRLWSKLDHMRQFLDDSWGANWKPCWFIAVTALIESSEQKEIMNLHGPGDLNPAVINPTWDLLGYDIADDGDISGLSNCGYGSDEAKSLRTRWGSRLNTYHLFDDLNQALEFKIVSDARVPEHAPFAVYGIYLVENHEQNR
jgi:hypothetical protein